MTKRAGKDTEHLDASGHICREELLDLATEFQGPLDLRGSHDSGNKTEAPLVGRPDDIGVESRSQSEGGAGLDGLDDLLSGQQSSCAEMDPVTEGGPDSTYGLRGGGGAEGDLQGLQSPFEQGRG